jgi:hypothetical protein
MRKLLNPVSLRIVEGGPVFPFSFKDSQLRLPSYPLPAAYSTQIAASLSRYDLFASFEPVRLDKLFEINPFEPQCPPNLHEAVHDWIREAAD